MHGAPSQPIVYNHQHNQPIHNTYEARNNPSTLPPIAQQTYQEDHYVERREEPTVYHSSNQVNHTPV